VRTEKIERLRAVVSGGTTMPEVIAVIAAGEMGAAIGRRLREHGARVVTSLADRSAATARRADAAGLRVMTDDDAVVAEADMLLSVVPPGEAAALAERLRPALARAKTKPLYIDCNAVAPQTAEAIGTILVATGCAYVDGGIIGPPPVAAAGRATRLFVSGEHAGAALRLNDYGLDTRRIDGPIGAASALKMSYAGLTKGFTALGVAMMLAAERAGCAEALRTELADSQPHFLAWLASQVPRMYPKAYRWVAEMEEIAGFAGGDAATADIYRAMARLYDRLATVASNDSDGGGDIDILTRFCAAATTRRST
jgi:3-hydroxyisobutyrate dehydrogenase-like beta-hydroxyacid dehydrogenase